MIGAIAGDIIGSVYEHHNIRRTDFLLFDPLCRYTDDSVLTVAIADCILHGGDYAVYLKEYCHAYPDAGYGPGFARWAHSQRNEMNNSCGNGSAMRVSPIGYAFETIAAVLSEAEKSAMPSHNHPEGIKGAQAVAAAVFIARTGGQKKDIKDFIQKSFGYDLNRSYEKLQKHYSPSFTCQGSVPEALISFLASDDFEDAVRKAIAIGGDSDTIACMAGGVAQAFYKGVPDRIKTKIFELLDDRLTTVAREFGNRYSSECRRVLS